VKEMIFLSMASLNPTIKEKGIWVSGLEIFNDCQLLEKDAFTLVEKDQSTQDWTHLVESNFFGILFG